MDESLDALIEVITAELSPATPGCFTERLHPEWTAKLIDIVADRVLKEIRRLRLKANWKGLWPWLTGMDVYHNDSISVDILDCS